MGSVISQELLLKASLEKNIAMKVAALILVFVASASAAGVCSPDQVSACRLQVPTFAKWRFTSTEDICNLCDLCVDAAKRVDIPECSTFCSVGKAECRRCGFAV